MNERYTHIYLLPARTTQCCVLGRKRNDCARGSGDLSRGINVSGSQRRMDQRRPFTPLRSLASGTTGENLEIVAVSGVHQGRTIRILTPRVRFVHTESFVKSDRRVEVVHPHGDVMKSASAYNTIVAFHFDSNERTDESQVVP